MTGRDFSSELFGNSAATSKPLFDVALEKEGVSGRLADVARSIYQQESGGGKNTATSNAGAVGHMQVIPATFSRFADQGWNIANPEQNIRAGLRFIKSLDSRAGGDPRLIGVGYYGGEGAIDDARRGKARRDPLNPNAPDTLQYGHQVASRVPSATPAGRDFSSELFSAENPDFSDVKSGVETKQKPSLGQMFAQEVRNTLPAQAARGLLRGVQDVAETGRRLVFSGLDKLAQKVGPGETNVAETVAARDAAGREQFKQSLPQGSDIDSLLARGGSMVARIGGNVAATLPLIGAAGAGVSASGLPALGNVIRSGGFMTGSPAAPGFGNAAGGLALRTIGGAAAGAIGAGAVNPDDIGTGAAIGGLLPGGVKAAGLFGKGAGALASNLLGATTGTSAETVKAALNAGKTGSREFLENMRGKVDFSDVVERAKEGLRTMRADRARQYRSGMVDIKADKTVLDMSPITNTTSEMLKSAMFKGKAINEKSYETMREIANKVDDWARAPKADFHTPEGLDALKQAIGDIRDTTQFGTSARRAADNVYNEIKSQIQKQAPTYSKVMKDYSDASRTLQEIEKTLSLGEKSSKDTAVRKLQSLMRNNAQSNYGNRLNLADILETQGGVSLRPAISGQAMSSALPRGMVGAMERIAIPGAAILGTPSALALAPFASPRLVGETLYHTGLLANKASRAASQLPVGSIGGKAPGLLSVEGLLENPLTRNALIQSTSH